VGNVKYRQRCDRLIIVVHVWLDINLDDLPLALFIVSNFWYIYMH
jgi:hypothetical protein